jgi:hypothetical protein
MIDLLNEGNGMDIVSVAELEQRYPDEWVLLEVVRDHKVHGRVAGHLIAHSQDRADLDQAYRGYRAAHAKSRLYEFYTGDLVAEGVVAIL